ncbi:hypothetical protein GCM10010464_64840 [Pseudonocardia yunnanensis]
MAARDAALVLLGTGAANRAPDEITNRTVMEEGPGRAVVGADSIAFGTKADTDRRRRARQGLRRVAAGCSGEVRCCGPRRAVVPRHGAQHAAAQDRRPLRPRRS